ncbi:cysteine dioxygenase [Aquamicrobium sp. NLF2-7]|jgi:predicted metal-dependent enzyme (double-stranded beta helix superfamily)|uniref:cysteine dioxygenase family protein n=1 Tax=Aquamicrobium sp. NLF2-7 TaxID=2918753 RepID=UPI001EFB6487|nr:cysteine dioxygenase [Aquamicrobium sp. NLF2-7]MCG8273770.1 cysteine dioxygenase [Aquamicrobium sp. NLF2-7]
MTTNTKRLRTFLSQMSRLVEEADGNEPVLLERGKTYLEALVAHDDWLPEEWAAANPDRYQQHLLYCDPQDRFCVVSFVWGPGQQTPIHNHTTWGLVGMLRGAEISEAYEMQDGKPVAGETERLDPGQVVMVSPDVGDIHKVWNACDDRVSISIHVYGGDIGAIERNVFPPEGGMKSFISGYSNSVMPNIWGTQA